MRRRLLQRGINLDELSAEEVAAAQPEIQAVIREIQGEQADEEAEPDEAGEANANPDGAANDPTADLGDEEQQVVDEAEADGATAAEAVSELEQATKAAEQSASQIYGHQIFRNRTLEVFRGDGPVRAPNTYVLDAGDELAVTIFGRSQADLLLEIGADGFVKPPQMPRIYLKGRTLGEAKDLVRSRMNNYYVFQDGQFSLTLNVARTVTISILGEVETSGTYTLSALNSALNALVAAGGPTELGTVRRIQLIREGKTSFIDVYKYLRNPSDSQVFGLRENDIIFVPDRLTIVNAIGGFKRPLFYELTEGETLTDLVDYAAGFTPRAEPSSTRVTRYRGGRIFVNNINFEQAPTYALQNADVVEVPVIENPIEEFITVEGAVLFPGTYARDESTTVGAVLELAQVRPTARLDLAFIERTNDDGTTRLVRLDVSPDSDQRTTLLRRGDVLTVLAQARFSDRGEVSISGAIRDEERTINYPRDGYITLEEALLLGGGLRPNARAEVLVIRNPEANTDTREYLRINVEESAEFVLQPNDQVVVYANERFVSPTTVSIEGAVQEPGEYTYNSALTLPDLIYMSGGLRLDAELERVEIYRLDLDGPEGSRTLLRRLSIDSMGQTSSDFDLSPFDQIVVRSKADFELIETINIRGQVRFPGPYALFDQSTRVTELIARAGGLTKDAFPAGARLTRGGAKADFIVLNLDEILKNPGGPSDIYLQSGDVIAVPVPQELVTIELPGTLADRFGIDTTIQTGVLQVVYQGNKDADWYVERFAGGFNNKLARKRWSTVEYASGQVMETNTRLGLMNFPEVRPGSTIRVGLKPEKRKKAKDEITNWNSIAASLVAGFTTVATLIALIRAGA